MHHSSRTANNDKQDIMKSKTSIHKELVSFWTIISYDDSIESTTVGQSVPILRSCNLRN
jgi:hypothetical protein